MLETCVALDMECFQNVVKIEIRSNKIIQRYSDYQATKPGLAHRGTAVIGLVSFCGCQACNPQKEIGN